LESDIRLSIEVLAKEGRLLLLANVQHWLDEGGEPQGPLSFVLATARELTGCGKKWDSAVTPEQNASSMLYARR
jgi:hypothetical protein